MILFDLLWSTLIDFSWSSSSLPETIPTNFLARILYLKLKVYSESLFITSWRARRCPLNFFWIFLAYNTPRPPSPIGPAVWPALRNIHKYECLVLLYRLIFKETVNLISSYPSIKSPQFNSIPLKLCLIKMMNIYLFFHLKICNIQMRDIIRIILIPTKILRVTWGV